MYQHMFPLVSCICGFLLSVSLYTIYLVKNSAGCQFITYFQSYQVVHTSLSYLVRCQCVSGRLVTNKANAVCEFPPPPLLSRNSIVWITLPQPWLELNSGVKTGEETQFLKIHVIIHSHWSWNLCFSCGFWHILNDPDSENCWKLLILI